MNGFLLALNFLTRLPLRPTQPLQPKDWRNAVLCFPLVGVVIGVILVAVAQLGVFLPLFLQAALVLCVWVLVTGIVHLDGFADSADALSSGKQNGEELLRIQKDPHVGVGGVVAVALALIVYYAALLSLFEQQSMLELALVPVLARALAAAFMGALPYINPNGLGVQFVTHLPKSALKIVLALVLLVGLALGRLGVLSGLLILAGLFWWWRRWLMRTFGGINGDHIGATLVTSELVLLSCLAAAVEI